MEPSRMYVLRYYHVLRNNCRMGDKLWSHVCLLGFHFQVLRPDDPLWDDLSRRLGRLQANHERGVRLLQSDAHTGGRTRVTTLATTFRSSIAEVTLIEVWQEPRTKLPLQFTPLKFQTYFSVELMTRFRIRFMTSESLFVQFSYIFSCAFERFAVEQKKSSLSLLNVWSRRALSLH